ncbi:MAG TPA: hypothetical protein VK455_04365 [Thermoplasmata archaeon]|nr:hypothetical protein [Thermoplasmata archaeon]
MGLFSDLDWLIIAAVAVFLLFGQGNRDALRTLGRWYGRANRLKQELLTEFSKAADLPMSGGGAPVSLRSTLLGMDPAVGRASGIPATVRVPPSAPLAPASAPDTPWTGGHPVPTWSTTASVGYTSTEGLR